MDLSRNGYHESSHLRKNLEIVHSFTSFVLAYHLTCRIKSVSTQPSSPEEASIVASVPAQNEIGVAISCTAVSVCFDYLEGMDMNRQELVALVYVNYHGEYIFTVLQYGVVGASDTTKNISAALQPEDFLKICLDLDSVIYTIVFNHLAPSKSINGPI